MSILRQVTYGVRHLFCVERSRRDLQDEIDQYVRDSAEAFVAAGISTENAQRAAAASVDPREDLVETLEQEGWEGRLQPYALDWRRAARHTFGFRWGAWSTALTLAFAIGLSAAVLSVGRTLLMGQPVALDGAEVLRLSSAWPSSRHTTERVTGPDMTDVRSTVPAFSSVSIYQAGYGAVQTREGAVYVGIAKVDSFFQQVFALKPALGRTFQTGDAGGAALVSDGFARLHFTSAAGAVGQTILVDGDRLVIIGVAPEKFNFPEGSDVWEAALDTARSSSRTSYSYQAVGRLRQGEHKRDASEQLETLSRSLQVRFSEDNANKELVSTRLGAGTYKGYRWAALLIAGTTLALFVLALLNSLGFHVLSRNDWTRAIAQGDARNMGPARVGRLVRLECALLSFVSGVGALVVASAVQHVVLVLARSSNASSFGMATMSAIVGLSSLAAYLILVAALRERSCKQNDPIRAKGNRVFRCNFPVWQGSLCLGIVLLGVGTVLLARTVCLRNGDAGFIKRDLLVFETSSQGYRFASPKDIQQGIDAVLKVFARHDGVESVAGAMGVPFDEYGSNGAYDVEWSRNPDAHAVFTVVTPAYFQTLQIPVLAGRDFNDLDSSTAEQVAIISESLDKQRFGGADALGRRIRCGLDTGKWMTVVGIVGDTKNDSMSKRAGPAIYMPLAQHPLYAGQLGIVVRTKLSAARLQQDTNASIHAVDPTMALRGGTMVGLIDRSLRAQMLWAVATIGFSIISFTFAALLLFYGVQRNPSCTPPDDLFMLGVGGARFQQPAPV